MYAYIVKALAYNAPHKCIHFQQWKGLDGLKMEKLGHQAIRAL